MLKQLSVLAAFALTTLPLGGAFAQSAATSESGAVYTQTNGVESNAVVAFTRHVNGTLTYLGTYATGGRGSGGVVDPLQSQDSVILNADHSLLFAVDSGSGDVTSFKVNANGSLTWADRAASGGGFPVSLAIHNNLLYVLNSGGAGAVAGFLVQGNGQLHPVANSGHYLSAASAGGSSIDFSPDGKYLLATERLTNLIDTFAIAPSGGISGYATTASHGDVPFAVIFTPAGDAVVAEAGGGPDGESATSSYAIDDDDTLSIITGSLSTGYKAGCWIVSTSDGKYAFTANAASSEISVDTIANDGALANLGALAAAKGSAPLDLAVSSGNQYLYALTAGAGTITGFEIHADGALNEVSATSAQKAASGQNGLAAY